MQTFSVDAFSATSMSDAFLSSAVGDDEAVVHVHKRSFPEELCGAVEDWAADDESFGQEVVEDVCCLLAVLGVDQNLVVLHDASFRSWQWR
jgi:hypothetical protein